MHQDQTEEHSTIQSILLHIFPGILTGCFYFLVRQPVINRGYPSVFALILAIALILIPVELGYLLYQGKKKTGRYTLNGIIGYRKSIPWWQYIVWVAAVFIATGLIFTLLKPVEVALKENLFFRLPGPDGGLDGNYSKSDLMLTYSLFFVFVAVLGPLVEELYFRGYLLPRMNGRYAGLLHSFLFAAYHIFTPWMIPTRTLGLLPLIYAVKKKNIYIGMIVHVLVNSIDVVTGVLFIASMA